MDKHPQDDFRFWATRLLVCLATAVIISASAYLCAWLRFRSYYIRTAAYVKTRTELEMLHGDIENLKKTTGALPANLTDLKVVKEKRVRVDDTGQPVDGWGRPWQYRVHDKEYQLFSFGADGMAGGFGQYADLIAGQEHTWPENPNLAEFSTLPEAWPIQLACLLAGVIAFPLCFLQARGRRGVRPTLGKVLLANAVTAVFAILAGLMIAALHIMPGGH
jgi:hypothetical protein